ncbi:MAG TPA: FAD-dependent monooxygenase [Actinomycetospora sp.]|nr:FAD-dependent monooxygenase [Actinomycetospora sp.]
MTAHRTSTDTEVVISGAGPVGLTLALALARRGVRTIVLERKDGLDPHSRATLLPPRSLEVLAGVGVLPALLRQGQRNPALAIHRTGDRRPVLRFDFAADADTTAVPFALAIPQDRTERTLLDAVQRSELVDVRFGLSLARFQDDGERVTVEAGDGTVVTARYLVGADGAHSGVRRRLGWPLEGTTYRTRAFLADVDVSPEADLRSGWLADPRAASFTLGIRFGDALVGDAVGGRWRLIESATPHHVTDADHPARARAITEAVFGAGSWRDTLWTAVYRKHERRARRYHLGRVVLAGDAAHLNSPAGGQGLNTGLQDALALAWRLARLVHGDGDRERLLGSYSEERAQAFDNDVRPVTDGIERMETLPAWLRSAAFAAVGLLGRTGLPRAVTRRLSMLSPTAVTSALLDGPDPVGRRLPDVALPDGRRLHDLLGPDGLLISSRPERTASPLDGLALATSPPTLPRPFGAHDELLVRPDHLVALVSDGHPLADDVVVAALGARGGARVA